nr:hypothetical protein [Tanacetum cinerariifolium]
MVMMVPHEAFACLCGAGYVVLRESYRAKSRGKLYYACPKSKELHQPQFFSPTPSTPPNYYGGSLSNTECSNCKHLLGMIKVLQATLEMYMHPEQHTLDSTALLYDLNNDMEKIATIIPDPGGVVQLSSNTRVEPYPSTSNSVRIIPGPAGIVQQAKLLKEKVFILDSDGALMSTQKYMQKIIKDVGEDDDFNNVAWVSATNYVMAFSGTVTECLGDIDNFLKKGKLDHVVTIVKSCSSNMLGELNVTLKDISDTIPGTIHHKVMSEGGYGKDITVGAAMCNTSKMGRSGI